MRRTFSTLLLIVALVAPAFLVRADGCRFQLGFATLATLLPQVVGLCVDDEQHDPVTGDALQHTTRGLLVWRKADNWTAFTDGAQTWINGPHGIVRRPNDRRFPWEANSEGLPTMQDHAPPRVLMVTATAGYHHASIDKARMVVPGLGDGALRVTLDTDMGGLAAINAHSLASYDVVLFANTSGELPLDSDQKQALLDFVSAGGGFVGTHSATDTFYTWPEYGQMVGAIFKEHPWTQDAVVHVDDQGHSSTQMLGTSFSLHEEFYTFRDNPRPHVHVLLSLDTGSVGTTGDYPLAWCSRYGSGRVFYTALGHFDTTWNDVRFQQHLLNGLLWAAGNDPRGDDACRMP